MPAIQLYLIAHESRYSAVNALLLFGGGAFFVADRLVKKGKNMKYNDTIKLSKFISLILRHKPEAVGISLDPKGWADVKELLNGINSTGKYRIDMKLLEEIVAMDEKQRYSFNEEKTKIRANQGHSVKVDVELTVTSPPEYLYHGTAERYVDSILESGLKPQSRLYVHLSKNTETANKVGTRHGKPYIFTVMAGEMHRQGYVFYLSKNGVWLTKFVPPNFLIEEE